MPSTRPETSAGASTPTATKVRIGITGSATAKQPESVVLAAPTFAAIVAAAAPKLKISPRSVKRLVLRTSVRELAAGSELPKAGDCSAFLKNDVLLWVSTTEAAQPA